VANMLNVVEVIDPRAAKTVPKARKKAWDGALEERSRAQWLKGVGDTKWREPGIHTFIDDVVKERVDAVQGLAWDAFLEDDQLPVPMHKEADPVLRNVSVSPRGELGDILDVVTALGFAVIPFEYLNPKAYEREGCGMKEAIKAFGGLKDRMDVYVVCPPNYYSLQRNIVADDPNQQIFAGRNEQAFMALRLTLPTLRAMQAQIKAMQVNQAALQRGQQYNREQVDEVRAGMTALRVQVEALETDVQAQLDQMQESISSTLQVETQKAVSAAAAVLNSRAGKATKAKAQALLDSVAGGKLLDVSAAAAALEDIEFDVLDPMMFALKKGTKLFDRGAAALMGPCWGPDFADIIAAAAGLVVDKARREKAETALQVWGCYAERAPVRVQGVEHGYDAMNEYLDQSRREAAAKARRRESSALRSSLPRRRR
jgi:hypothetical protein